MTVQCSLAPRYQRLYVGACISVIVCLHLTAVLSVQNVSFCDASTDPGCKCDLHESGLWVECRLEDVGGTDDDVASVKIAFYSETRKVDVYCAGGRFSYGEFFLQNISLTTTVDTFFMRNCPLPDSLSYFFRKLSIGPVSHSVEINSLPSLGDTVDSDFLRGVDAARLSVSNVHQLVIDDDVLASMSALKALFVHRPSSISISAGAFHNSGSLKSLVLSSCKLERIPDMFFSSLIGLENLNLKGNRLEFLHDSVLMNQFNMKFLNLGNNNLSTLPVGFLDESVNLVELRLSMNDFSALPSDLFKFNTKLEFLKLGPTKRGSLTGLSGEFLDGLDMLREIHLQGLGLQELPRGIFSNKKSVKKLKLERNNISEMHEDIFAGMLNATHIFLSDNPVSNIGVGTFQDLVHLEELYMREMRLDVIPDNLFSSNVKLAKLDLAYNLIRELTSNSFLGAKESLQDINLSNNRIEVLMGDIFVGMPKLVYLNLAYNNISSIPVSLHLLLSLNHLDLQHNAISSFNTVDMNFFSEGVHVNLNNNKIRHILLHGALDLFDQTGNNKPNTFDLSGNPLACDCLALGLRSFLAREDHTTSLHAFINLVFDVPLCHSPGRLRNMSLMDVSVDDFVCPMPSCPERCVCLFQGNSGWILVKCVSVQSGMASYLMNFAFESNMLTYEFHVDMKNAGVVNIGNLSSSLANITSLDFSHNNISYIDPSELPSNLSYLKLDHNGFTVIPENFVSYISNRTSKNKLTLTLGKNPYVCNCSVLPLMRFLKVDAVTSGSRVVDAEEIGCSENGMALMDLTEQDVCPGESSLVVSLCLTLVMFVLLLLFLVVCYYKYGETVKIWLFSHDLCLSYITEEEVDSDKLYDAFISYSHLDEDFVIDQLVPRLEKGDPSYSLCLHFRDWTAGEWITDQIERSVQCSRRVIVVVSQNFVNSDWGRLEFVAAHRQALNDNRNRLIVIVYGQLPDVSCLDAELRLYLTMNTYLRWDDPLFWQRLRYALPHARVDNKTMGNGQGIKVCKKEHIILTSTSTSKSERDAYAYDSGINSDSTELSSKSFYERGSLDGHTNCAFDVDKLSFEVKTE